jgi:CRISPR-associated protein (TIGR03986 family)
VDDKYFIPATSIKGAIRNVLEIMSFSKLKLDTNMQFATRDWDNKDLYPLRNVRVQSTIKCGWLKPKGNDYVIIDCDKPYRINHKRIDKYFNHKVFENTFSENSLIDLNKELKHDGKEYDPKTASYKYALVDSDALIDIRFSEDGEYNNEHIRNRVRFDKSGNIKGTIVLTGQPDKWKIQRRMNGGKFYEFVFGEPTGREHPITEDNFKKFKFIYSESKEWAVCTERLKKEGIPVFFRLDNDEIKDFGLAYLYKLPYDHSASDLLKPDHRNKEDEFNPDLSECIFGYTYASKKLQESIKGRVQFSAAFSDDKAIVDEDVILTLGSPKASYYPIYIRQYGQNGKVVKYSTYNDGALSGWKRYPVRKKIWGTKSESDYNASLDTKIHPLKKGVVFNGKIRFHNLKKEELGALLSALTFHNTDNCFHQIGQGKPYGFGKVKIEIILPEHLEAQQVDLMTLFENAISKKISNWHSSDSIVQLFTMAREEVTTDDILFQYMKMDTNSVNNHFLTAKQNNEYLELYSSLIKKPFIPNSLLLKQLEEERLKKEQEEKAEQEKLANMSPDNREKEKYQNLSDFGSLINASLANSELTNDFFLWLKSLLIEKRIWKIDGDAKKDKSIKRCLAIETKINSN